MKSVVGFLYGHYDSRGGASFLVAPNRSLADKNYAYLFGYCQTRLFNEDRWFYSYGDIAPIPKADLSTTGFPRICDEDFLAGPLTLELPDEFPTDDLAKEVTQTPTGVELLYDYANSWDPNTTPPYAGEIYALVKDPNEFEVGDSYPDAENIIKLRLIKETDVKHGAPVTVQGYTGPVTLEGEPVPMFADAEGTWVYTEYGEDACGVVLGYAVDTPEVV